MKLKQIALATAVATATIFSAHAATQSSQYYREGMYFGGGFSGAMTNVQHRMDVPGFIGPNSTAFNSGQNAPLLGGNLFLGYQWMLNDNYLFGVQISGGKHFGDVSASTFPFNNKVSQQWFVEPSVWLGDVITDQFMAYMKVGVPVAKYGSTLSVYDDAESLSSEDTFVGVGLGLGMNFALTQTLSLYAEYNYNYYMRGDLGRSTFSGSFSGTVDQSLQPTESVFAFGLKATF